MEHLTEQVYIELNRHIIQRLEELSAYGVLEQIKVLLKEYGIDQPNVSSYYGDMLSAWDSNNRSSRSDEGQEAPQSISHQELYRAIIDILETYLLKVPKMTELTVKNLGLMSLADIAWGDETSPTLIDGLDYVTPSLNKDRDRIAELIAGLKALA